MVIFNNYIKLPENIFLMFYSHYTEASRDNKAKKIQHLSSTVTMQMIWVPPLAPPNHLLIYLWICFVIHDLY